MVRICGSCTACCKTHPVPEVGSLTGRWCQYCIPGEGCRKYADRPEPCRIFQCEWLRGAGGERDRPDVVKYVVDHIPTFNRLQIWEAKEGGLHHPNVGRLTNEYLERGVEVSHIYLSGIVKLFIPGVEVVTGRMTTR